MGHQLNQELLQKLQKGLENSMQDGRLGKALGELPKTEQEEKKTLPLPALEEERLAKKLQDALSRAVEDGRFGKALEQLLVLQQSNVVVLTTPPEPEAQEVAPEVTPEEPVTPPAAAPSRDTNVQQTTFSEDVVQKLRSTLQMDLKAALEDGRLSKALSLSEKQQAEPGDEASKKVAAPVDDAVDCEEEKVMSGGKLPAANDDDVMNGFPSIIKPGTATICVPKRDGVMRRLIRFTCGKLSGRGNQAIEEA
jgi:hypothetical protein